MNKTHLPDNVADTKAWSLLRFQEAEPLRDHVKEIAALLDLSDKEAEAQVEQVLGHYHYGKGEMPSISWDAFGVIVHVTQSFRIPVMTIRMDLVLDVLGRQNNITTVLDYGGGGGKDSIILARQGYDVSFCDLTGLLTPHVQKRFEIRNLAIPIYDVRSLPDERYSCINCMDVLEHIYDFEYVLADVVARLEVGGVLACWPACYNDWTGDHWAKNCAYNYFFESMMNHVGMTTLCDDRKNGVLCYVKKRCHDPDIVRERALLRRMFYEMSRRVCRKRAIRGVLRLPAGLVRAWMAKNARQRESIINTVLSEVIDNVDVFRLSNHRLVELDSPTFSESRE